MIEKMDAVCGREETWVEDIVNIIKKDMKLCSEEIVGPGDNQQAVFTSLMHYIDNADLKVPFVKGASYKKKM